MSIASEIIRIQRGKKTLLTALQRIGYNVTINTKLNNNLIELLDPICKGESLSYLEKDQNYLTFKWVQNGAFYWKTSDASWTKDIQYKKNGTGEWITITSSTSGYVCDCITGDEIWVKGNNTTYASANYYCSFKIIGKTYISGNVNSLLNFNTILTDYCFGYLFYNCSFIDIDKEHPLLLPATTLTNYCYGSMFSGCTSLTTAPVLSAIILAVRCYYSMFFGCTSLVVAPQLPATTLANYCYIHMFSDCTSLTSTPELPATTLAQGCYQYMFSGCTALTTAPALPATTLVNSCYGYMFQNCTSLITAPALPATTLAYFCYEYMFNGCSSLTTAPALPATTLASGCYYYMFYGCASLTTAPELPATTLASKCYSNMFYGCASLVVAPQLPATTLVNECYYYMFSGCTALTTAPALPATTLASGCYKGMFLKCTSLTTAPVLPATTLASGCYQSMFQNCTSLITAPALPATTLAYFCYEYMFNGCSSLTTAPALPATTLANSCYYYMFSGCTSLTTAPELPATTLADSCYSSMFYGCTALTTAPALPATTLASGCYQSMFQNCTSLTTAPKLPATILAGSCYNQMFQHCTSLNYIKCLATDISASSCTNNWLLNVAVSGIFIKANNMRSWTTGESGIPLEWKNATVNESQYLTFESIQDTIFTFSTNALQYSLDNGSTWTTLAADTATPTVSAGNKIMWKQTGLTPTKLAGIGTFSATGNFKAYGNIMSLYYANNFIGETDLTGKNYAFYQLFNGNTKLITTENLILPAIILADSCYADMFEGCTSLTTTPELPATTLAQQCYSLMFSGCTSLTTAPALPATTLANSCYNSMFSSCTSLVVAPQLPATTLADDCYENMFDTCTSLTTAPVLPATTLKEYCYAEMFYNCTSLNYIKCLATDISASSCTNSWVTNVASSGTFVKAASMSSWTTGTSGIPSNWTVEDATNSNNTNTLRIWIDDFGSVTKQEAYDNYIHDGGGIKKYILKNDTLTIDNITYYIWEMDDNHDYCYDRYYILTTTNNYNTLVSQSLTNDIDNNFTSFGGFLNKDSEEGYVDGNNRIQLLLEVVQNNNDLHIYVDNIKSHELSDRDLEDYTSDPGNCGSNPYILTNNTITTDNNSYYIWELDENNAPNINSNIQYLLTTSNNYNTLLSESLETSIYNMGNNKSLYSFMNEDNEIYGIDENDIFNQNIVKVEQIFVTPHLKIWIDDFCPMSRYEIYDNYINNTCDKKYQLTNDTITLDETTYYIWACDDNYNDYANNKAFILTTTNNYNTLVSQSLDNNMTNNFTSFGGFLNKDSEESYMNEDYVDVEEYILVDVEQNGNNLYIYVDNIKYKGLDDSHNIDDYLDDPEGCGSNPYTLTEDTIIIDGETYYIWQRDENIGSQIEYLLTTSIDYNTLVSESLETSLNNIGKIGSVYTFMDDDDKIYEENIYKQNIIKVETY